MATREEMLKRVRQALGRPLGTPAVTPLPDFNFQGIMPPLAPTEYQAKFAAEWEKVAGVAHYVSTIDELEALLRKIAADLEAQGVVLSRNPLLTELRIAERLRAAGISVVPWAGDAPVTGAPSLAEFHAASFQAKIGITGVDYVLAETGGLVLSSQTEGAQLASLAPPVHIALYRQSQLVGSLEDVLAKLPVSNPSGRLSPGRSVVIVTGTSRTADIEQILIRGVHGPGAAHAVLVEDSCR